MSFVDMAGSAWDGVTDWFGGVAAGARSTADHIVAGMGGMAEAALPYVTNFTRHGPSEGWWDNPCFGLAPEPWRADAPAAEAPAPEAAPEIDPKVLEARARAAAFLNGGKDKRFQIVGDDFTGPRTGNQVSQEKFDEICDLFASISSGSGDLSLSFSADEKQSFGAEEIAAQRGKMLGDVASILQTETGRKVLGRLNDNVVEAPGGGQVHRQTALHLLHENHENLESNADDDIYVLDHENAPMADPEHVNLMSYKGGTDVDVRYVPGETYKGSRSDVTLLHELIHALDMTAGQQDSTPVADPSGAQTERCEHQTIGLTDEPSARDASVHGVSENAYRRERAAMGAAGVTGTRAGDRGMPERHQHGLRDGHVY